MKTKHIFSESIYWIHNASVSRTELFQQKSDIDFFKLSMKKYLEEICNIIAFHFIEDQFSLLVQIKPRIELIRFFKRKHNKSPLDDFFIPATSYIFSQQMSNLQNSYAKHYNWKYNRKGSLFSGRFKRHLVNNLEECLQFRHQILTGYRFHNPARLWKVMSSRKVNRALEYKWALEIEMDLNKRMKIKEIDLRGCFINLPPKDLFPKLHRVFIYRYRKKFSFGPNMN